MSNPQCDLIAPRRGLTLVELLVVLGILAILMGIAATAVKTGTRGKKQREAARQVNAFIAGAQARAMELNRPVGIEIVRNVRDADSTIPGLDTGISNTSLLMFMIETPPVYAGDITGATMQLSISGNTVTLDDSGTNYATASSLLKTTDTPEVRLNYRGRKYKVTITSLTPLQLQFTIPAHDHTRFSATTFVPVQIHLPPQRSSVTPIQLPTDMCIDLHCSGLGAAGNEFANWAASSHEPIRITFSPSGNVDAYSVDGTTWHRPTGNIHLLVGKYEYAVNALEILIDDGQTDGISDINLTSVDYSGFLLPSDPDLITNLADGTSMWVSINYLTGQVTTSRNAVFPAGTTFATGTGQPNRQILSEARRFATSVITVRGQEDS